MVLPPSGHLELYCVGCAWLGDDDDHDETFLRSGSSDHCLANVLENPAFQDNNNQLVGAQSESKSYRGQYEPD